MTVENARGEVIAKIVASYAARPDVTADDIVYLYDRLIGGEVVPLAPVQNSDRPSPALPLERAITEDTVYCLCCGRGFKMLKRHLGAEHGLTEAEYRTMFDLPEDMPLVAPSYSVRKAAFAKKAGFGKYDRQPRRESAKS